MFLQGAVRWGENPDTGGGSGGESEAEAPHLL